MEPNTGPALIDVQRATVPADQDELGRTYIADTVVSTIAHIAAEQVEGVHRLGESTLRGLISRLGRGVGVASEVGMKEAAIDLDVVVAFGYPIKQVAVELRRTVIESVEFMTGRKVVEVNVHVIDIHVPRTRVETKSRRHLE